MGAALTQQVEHVGRDKCSADLGRKGESALYTCPLNGHTTFGTGEIKDIVKSITKYVSEIGGGRRGGYARTMFMSLLASVVFAYVRIRR